MSLTATQDPKAQPLREADGKRQGATMMRVDVKNLDELVDMGVVQLTRGKIISKTDMDAYPGTFPVYSSAKENDGKFGEYGRFMFDEELITWSVDGGGRLFHRPHHKFSVTNVGGVLRILDNSVLDYKYLYYALSLRHSETAFDWVKKAHPSIIRTLYRDIPVAPLPEQRRIVALLDEVFAGIATAKANAERNLQNARALFESQLDSFFIQRSEGWIENKLGDVTTKIGSGATPRGGEESYKAEGISLIRSLNVHDLGFRYARLACLDSTQASELANVEVRVRDVLLNITGASVARCCIVPIDVVPARVNQHVSIIRPIDVELHPEFLHFLLISKTYKDRLLQTGEEGGSTRQAITKAQIQNFSVWYPGIPEEQMTIVHRLKNMLVESQHLALLYERKLAALEELRKSLLQRAFSGDL